MVATPMRLEDALRFNGYSIVQTDVPAQSITTPEGTILIPDMILSSLVWGRSSDLGPGLSDAFYLDRLNPFDPAYQPILLSHILDRFSTRRLGYDTPDMFGLAVRRWLNLNMGPFSVLNRMYTSTAIPLPLTTDDMAGTADTTDHGRVASSDFPQTQLAADVDYASSAVDRSSTSDLATTEQGRKGRSVMELLAEQRAAYLNADAMFLDSFESLFLGVFDRSEWDNPIGPPLSAVGFLPTHW